MVTICTLCQNVYLGMQASKIIQNSCMYCYFCALHQDSYTSYESEGHIIKSAFYTDHSFSPHLCFCPFSNSPPHNRLKLAVLRPQRIKAFFEHIFLQALSDFFFNKLQMPHSECRCFTLSLFIVKQNSKGKKKTASKLQSNKKKKNIASD